MATVVERRKRKQTQHRDGYLRLDGISWDFYESLLEAVEQKSLRITYDHGILEIMTITRRHEWLKDALRRMIDILIEELDLPFDCYGSMNFKSESKKRGLQPDECFWFHSEELIRNAEEYEPESDPPPDLILEIDITSSSLDRINIHESFGVSEVWRWKDDQVEFHILNKKGKLKTRKKSTIFTGLGATDLLAFLEVASSKGKATLVKEFRRWVRERVASEEIRFGGSKK